MWLFWKVGIVGAYIIIAFFVSKTIFLSIVDSIQTQPTTFILYTIIFLIIGLMWSFYKWFRFVKKRTRDYLSKVEERSRTVFISDFLPDVSKNKSLISTWIIFWPISVARYLCGNILVDMTNYLIKKFASTYQSISNRLFEKARKEAEELTKEKEV